LSLRPRQWVAKTPTCPIGFRARESLGEFMYQKLDTTADNLAIIANLRNRPMSLSITHNFCPRESAELNIAET
jgi:hypothetical protein